MKLYLVHCGFYDDTVGMSTFEFHTNFFVTALCAKTAKQKVKQMPQFKEKRMHIDGTQQIEAVDGFRIKLTKDNKLNGQSVVNLDTYRQLANSNK